MKMFERIENELLAAGTNKDNVRKAAGIVIEIVQHDEAPNDLIHRAVNKYMNQHYTNDNEEVERMVAGVMAFIQVNLDERMYYPVYGTWEVEDKKWWQFWKK